MNGLEEEKGISLELNAGVAEELRLLDEERRRRQTAKRRGTKQDHASSGPTDDAPYSDPELDQASQDNDDDDDDWEAMLMIPPHLQKQSMSEDDEDDDDQDVDDDDESDNNDQTLDEMETLSLSPPTSLPVLMIDLERLLGFQPSTVPERESLTIQIQQAVWGTSPMGGDDDGETKHNPDGFPKDFVSEDFELRVAELLETGAARHSDQLSLPRDHNNKNKNDTTPLRHDDNDDNDDTAKDQDNETQFTEPDRKWLPLEYPPYFCTPPETTMDAEIKVIKTAHVWKLLLKQHPVAVVDRLLQHLRNCNRCLSYKVELRREIVQLATREEKQQTRRQQEQELRQWKFGKRQAQLAQLYTVRETLDHRTLVARRKLQTLTHDLETTVATQLRQQRLANGQDVGLEAFDFASTLFSFPKGFMGGALLPDENQEEEDDDYYHNDDDDYKLVSETEEYGDDGESFDSESEYDGSVENDLDDNDHDNDDQEEVTKESPTLPITTDSTAATDLSVTNETTEATSSEMAPDVLAEDGLMKKRTRRSRKSNKAQRKAAAQKRRQRVEHAAKEEEHERKLAIAKDEEERMRELCTTHELKVAQALVISLDERLAKVDELIETLQEEEWEDEEEGVQGPSTDDDHEQEQPNTAEQVSLLDQILAMVLGATVPPPGKDMKAHVVWLHQEHEDIVQEWKSYFGRLPPPLPLGGQGSDTQTQPPSTKPSSPQTTVAPPTTDEMRQAFGIEHLETGNWDDDDEDEHAANDVADTKVPSRRPPSKGLRPGGRID